jgi:hypothetical protein
MNKPRYRLQASGTTNTYAYCWIAASRAVKLAEARPPGYLYHCMTAGVFAAFAVEAFLNHIGQMKVRDWSTLERRLGPREKLVLLRQVVCWSFDEGKRPYQGLRNMLRLRDSLAHGKTVTVNEDVVVAQLPSDDVRWPEPDWKRLCTAPSVKRMVEDAEAIIRDLAKQSGIARDPLASTGHGHSGIQLLDA